MIIFDLDGTLADCEHRRHFVDRYHDINEARRLSEISLANTSHPQPDSYIWQPDYKAYNEACDKDSVIEPTKIMYEKIAYSPFSPRMEIWSGRCESQREKTLKWIIENLYLSGARINNLGETFINYLSETLKMRPEGDNTPLHELKKKWFDEYMNSICPKLPSAFQETDGKIFIPKYPIYFVFESDVASMAMWNRRGIFVFDCNQRDKGF